MDVRLRELAARQRDLVAAWQLLDAGWSWRRLEHHRRRQGWGTVHAGVYALTSAPLTRHQLWIAATLTAPGTFLSHGSAGACLGIRPFDAPFEVVTRHGSGGRLRAPGLLVYRSTTLQGETELRDGIRITTAPRTMIDLAPSAGPKATARMFREALRLKTTTIPELRATLVRHHRRRGTAQLNALATRYSSLPYARAKSDAEALALELLQDARIEPPRLNRRVAGEEADLSWPQRRLIVELDGPQYHQFQDEDARKQRAWEKAGYTVRRLPTDAVYEDPARLLALAP